jgi:hypothetical protein
MLQNVIFFRKGIVNISHCKSRNNISTVFPFCKTEISFEKELQPSIRKITAGMGNSSDGKNFFKN